MNNKVNLKERSQLMRAAGLLIEDEDSDYDMGTPSGDTDAMGNIAEDMYGNSFKSIGQVIDLLAFIGDYMQDRADSGEESDELGNYSMNKEAQFSSQIDDAIEYLQGLDKKDIKRG